MNFVNNWSRPIELAAGADSLELDLPDGEYLLTITDSVVSPTRWEIVGAELSGGEAALDRGLDGTADQEWPAGSVIYCGLTSRSITEIFAALASLDARLVALEPPPPAEALVSIEIVFDPWWFGDYPYISSVSAMVDGVVAHEFDLMQFAGDDVNPIEGGVRIGYSGDTTLIETNAALDPAWDQIRIEISAASSFGVTATAYASTAPETALGTDTVMAGTDPAILTLPLA